MLNPFFKVALTGTPVMNNLTELFNIVDFLNPGFLGNRNQFIKEYEKPISASRHKNASNDEIKLGI